MRTKLLTGFVLIVMLIASVFPALAEGVTEVFPLNPPPTTETGIVLDETSSLWFIELKSKPAINGTSLATIAREQSNFRAAAAAAGMSSSSKEHTSDHSPHEATADASEKTAAAGLH